MSCRPRLLHVHPNAKAASQAVAVMVWMRGRTLPLTYRVRAQRALPWPNRTVLPTDEQCLPPITPSITGACQPGSPGVGRAYPCTYEGAIGFREAPAQLFRQAPLERQSPKGLVFRLRSFEYMALHGWIRAPRLQRNVRFLVLSAPLQQNNDPDGAYKQLLRDVVRRDCSLFLHHNEIEWAWRVLDPVPKVWQQGAPESYAGGSEGPTCQHRILKAGHRWRSVGKRNHP